MIHGKRYSARNICEIVGGRLIGDDVSTEHFSIDSRDSFCKNHCYIAIVGKNKNGNDYVMDAIKNGASLIVTNQKKPLPVSQIVVEDTVKALGKLASYNKGETRIIAVTGSVGKTTTKELLLSVLMKKYKVTATKGNQNNEIGVALTLLSITNEDYCIVEMGMRGKGQIDYLADMAKPYISVITNIGVAHIEMLGSREAIFNAKCELIPYTKDKVFVPDDPLFERFFNNSRFIVCGRDYSLSNVKLVEEKTIFNVVKKGISSQSMTFKSISRDLAENALIAYSVADYLGVDEKRIIEGIEEYHNEINRDNLIKLEKITLYDDCYNASFDSMRSAIVAVHEYSAQNKINAYALLGNMLELGDGAYEYHYRIGELCRDCGFKMLFVSGAYKDAYIDGFGGGCSLAGGDEAVDTIKKCITDGGVLLIKASRALKFENIVKRLKEIYDE